MTPDKITEGFEAWGKFLENDHNGYIYSEQAWQACAEWMLSQVEKEFDLAICSEWQGTLTEYELSQVKNVWMIARLSSAKEIASLKDQILRYEQDNRELRAKGIKEIAEKDEQIKSLQGKSGSCIECERMAKEIAENKHYFDVLKDDHARLTSENAELQSKLQYSQEWFHLAENEINKYKDFLKEIRSIHMRFNDGERVNSPIGYIFDFTERELASKKEST